MSKLINSINHLLALMRAFPNSQNFGAWKKKVEGLIAELKELIKEKNGDAPFPFLNATQEKDIALFMFAALIFSLTFDDQDAPTEENLKLIVELKAEMIGENLSEAEHNSLEEWVNEYESNLNNKNGYAPS